MSAANANAAKGVVKGNGCIQFTGRTNMNRSAPTMTRSCPNIFTKNPQIHFLQNKYSSTKNIPAATAQLVAVAGRALLTAMQPEVSTVPELGGGGGTAAMNNTTAVAPNTRKRKRNNLHNAVHKELVAQ
jgi:hypothetical protein